MKYDPLNDGISKLEYIDHMGDDLRVVEAARVSYSNDLGLRVSRSMMQKLMPDKDVKLIRYLLDNNHTSPLEHNTVTFMVKCPLFVRSQWHRHRMASYNEVSRRYTSEEIEFYFPTAEELRIQDTKNKQSSVFGSEPAWSKNAKYLLLMREQANRSMDLYKRMLGDDIAREQARMVLPQNLYTRFYYTANLHSILHFYRLRADSHAQYEIRVYAEAIGDIMMSLFPVTWEAATT